MPRSRMRPALWLFVSLLGGVLLLAPGCAKAPPVWPEGKAPRLLVTLPPLASLVANVAGDDGAIICLFQNTGPHEYQATAQDMMKVRDDDLFFINGLDLDESFAKKLTSSAGNPRLKVVALGDAVPEAQRIAVAEGNRE